MSNVLDGDLEVSEFKLQSRSYVHFWYKAFGKGIDPPSYVLNSIPVVLQQGGICY